MHAGKLKGEASLASFIKKQEGVTAVRPDHGERSSNAGFHGARVFAVCRACRLLVGGPRDCASGYRL